MNLLFTPSLLNKAFYVKYKPYLDNIKRAEQRKDTKWYHNAQKALSERVTADMIVYEAQKNAPHLTFRNQYK